MPLLRTQEEQTKSENSELNTNFDWNRLDGVVTPIKILEIKKAAYNGPGIAMELFNNYQYSLIEIEFEVSVIQFSHHVCSY